MAIISDYYITYGAGLARPRVEVVLLVLASEVRMRTEMDGTITYTSQTETGLLVTMGLAMPEALMARTP